MPESSTPEGKVKKGAGRRGGLPPGSARDKAGLAGAVAAVVVFYLILEGAGITCPILFLTGISCAGCGMSRAWLSLLKGDLAAAVSYHPLFWLPVPVLCLWLCRGRLSGRLYRFLMAAAVALALVVYVLRMLDPEDTVVRFTPGDGLIAKVLFSFLPE